MAGDQDVPNLNNLVDQLVDGLYDPDKLTRLQRAFRNSNAEAFTIAKGLAFAALDGLFEKLGTVLFGIEEHVEGIAGPPLARIVGHLLGVEVTTQELRESATAGGDPRVGKLVAELALRALSADAGELRPGRQGAEKFLAMIAQLVVNGWFEGTAFEILTTLIPDMDSFESVAELPEHLVNALGLGRLARVALRPLAQTLVATPLTWELNQKYSPALLSETTAIEEYLSGRLEWDALYEELTRNGWSDARIDSLVRNKTKQLSLDEAITLERHGQTQFGDTINTLRESGWLDETARLRYAAAFYNRLDAVNDNAHPTLVRAYIDGDLSESELRTLVAPHIYDKGELDSWMAAATLQKENTHTHLTQGEVIACVRANILPTAYYREWLQLHRYSEEEALALELLLRTEIDKETSLEEHRKQIEHERAAEKAEREKEKAEKLAKAEADRALARRGSLADLRRAAVRGLIPFARVEELLAPQYDADFIATYMDLVEADRVEYLRQQQAREDAEKRAANRRIDVGALEQAVLNNVLDFGRFHQALLDRGINADDANLLTATLQARKKDLDDAKASRAAAAAAAKIKHIDLSKFESLVRRGVRSLGDYDALLRQLGFEDASRAAMTELLQLQINDDAAARKAKDDAAAALRNKGVSLETERRAVVLGLQSIDDYERFLRGQGFGTDAIALMLREVQVDVDAAADAKQRREDADDRRLHPELPLSEIRRAARLGIIDVATYQQRLQADGYSPDDVEIELTLLLQEIADVQAARQKQDQVDKTVTAGLTLAQIAAAVRAGVKHLEDYRAAAAANPALSRDDIDTLVRVLADELAGANVARARRAALASTVQPKDVSIGALEEQVRAGTLSIPAYVGALEQAGLDDVDIDLLVQLLVDQLAASP